ncbi:Stp1/IreP family PP2C-type Ser/Thr phosphatase [Fictibacillus sp. Mic-4]|uniref:Stp1/IreP family PP2C-type Ser/Thr phosphatase n=1 Tax=Fictibacillus sp. Mic-4 TaxID=3132826 RepID=UPI003CF965DD
MKYALKTDTGKVRQHNEDSGGVFTKGEHFLAIVADGMGGHKAGDVASSKSVSLLNEKWKDTDSGEVDTPEKAEKWLLDAVEDTNQKLFQHAKENKECDGMGTTLVAAICTPASVSLLHIGDSRCYLLKQGSLTKMTEDHTLVNELVRSGQLSEDEAENHPRKHWILRALGTEETINVDLLSFTWEKGDVVLLCSDGLSNKVSRETMEEMLNNDQLTIHEQVERLVSLANEAGGEDNITIVLISNDREEQEREAK